MDAASLLKGYDLTKLTVGVLGGHSALDVCHGAKELGFRTLAVARKGREKTYAKYFATREDRGCIDETIVVNDFQDVLNADVQKQLRERNTVFVHNRYFWVYFDDFAKGVIDTTHLIYYISFITFGLFLTAKSVDSERWRG